MNRIRGQSDPKFKNNQPPKASYENREGFSGNVGELPPGSLRMIPIGGLGEIGKNMMALEYGDTIIIIDAGLMFPEEGMLGVDLILPNIDYLEEHRDKVGAILITHGHEDHTGALPYILKRLNVPIYTAPLTHGLIQVKLREHGLLNSANLNVIEPGQKIEIGPFGIEFFRVCHSIPDAMGIAINTPLGLVVHTGDFKIDHDPVDGYPTDFSHLAKLCEHGVLLLLSDSTYAELPGFTPSETVVEAALDNIISKASGRVLVATFASLISRVQQIINIAADHRKGVAVIGRSLVDNTKMAIEMGYLQIPKQVLKTWKELKSWPDEDIVVITTGAQGEPTSGLVRMSRGDHRDISIKPNDTIVLSASPIPGNERLINQTIDNLLRHGASVLHPKNALVHVHGHASEEELKIILRITSPKYFIPIHGEYHHLVAHSNLALSMGIPYNNIFTLEDGQVLEVDNEKAAIVGEFCCDHVFVSGGYLWNPTNTIFRERKALSTDGIVIAIFPVNKLNGELSDEPRFVSKGVLNLEDDPEIMRDCCKELMQEIGSQKALGSNILDDSRKIEQILSKSLYTKTGQRPVVQTIVVSN